MSTSPFPQTDRAAFREAVAAIAAQAQAKLPECNGRIEAAVKLVLAGDVTLRPDGTAEVYSASNGVASYAVVNGHCDCADSPRAPHGYCKHRLSAAIARRVTELALPAPAPEPEAPASVPVPAPAPVAVLGLDPRFVVTIQGTPFVKFAGLLALAHQRGLQSLTVAWTYNDAELSLAAATAVFPFGTFAECGDASPASVNRKVALHFRRVACTRAAARALRLALGIDTCSLEELADEAA